MADPGQACQFRLATQDQIGERAAGEVRRADAVTDVAAGPGEARGRVQTHRGAPVAGDAQRAAPGVGDRQVNVVAAALIFVSVIPIYVAQRLSGDSREGMTGAR